jgi:hypothetical protein
VDRYQNASGVSTTARGGGAAYRSGLVIDLDHQSARAIYIGQAEGQYRLISAAAVQSTAMPPIDDISVGARQALRVIEEHTSQQVVGPEGVVIPASGEFGVDLVAITGHPVAPIRLSVVAIGASPLTAQLVASARRTSTVIDVLTERVRTSDGVFSGALLEQGIRYFRPDALVLIEGDTAGNEWTSATGTLSQLVDEGIVNLVIIVAADQFQQQAAQALGDRADLRGIDPAEFTPADIASALEAELHALYEARVDTHALVAATEPVRYVSRIRAGDLVTRFLARRGNQAVVALDLSDGLMIHWATPEVSDVMVRPDMDLSRNIRTILSSEWQRVGQWLPFQLSSEEIAHWVLNRALRPTSMAESTHDMAVERAILIELARSAWTAMAASSDARIDVIVAGHPFSTMRSAPLAAITLLDIFQPDPASGIVDIVLDVDGLMPAAGAIGERSPAMAADLVENDLLSPFAAALIVKGNGNDGELAARGQVQYENGETTRFSVTNGSIHRLDFIPGQNAKVTVMCESGYSIGGQQQFPDLNVGWNGDLRPGEVGLLIDARNRPVRMPSDAGSRASRTSNWLEDIGFRV